MTAARNPDAQTLLIVSEETSLGMPPLIWAWREGICPWPAWSTCPMTTCSTCSGSTAARSSAAVIAVPPSSTASSEDRPPPILPIGVRAAPRITVLDMDESSCDASEGSEIGNGSGPVNDPTQDRLRTGADHSSCHLLGEGSGTAARAGGRIERQAAIVPGPWTYLPRLSPARPPTPTP